MPVQVIPQRWHQPAPGGPIGCAGEPVACPQRGEVDGIEQSGNAEHGTEDSLASRAACSPEHLHRIQCGRGPALRLKRRRTGGCDRIVSHAD